MLRSYLYAGLLAVFAGAAVYIAFFHKANPIPKLHERRGDLALGGEWTNTKKAIEGLLATLRQDPDNTAAKLQLAEAYIQESRVTGDHAYYDGAAMDLLTQVLQREPENFEALCCQATVLLSQHHFEEALGVATRARTVNPYNSYIYGMLCDAHLELGNYPEAVKMADQMVAVRPDLRSYSRVSYLREVHGDVPGAIEAMKLAVSAGYPGLEQTAWAEATLGHLYEISGDLDHAEGIFNRALAERPRYAFATAGLGRVAAARGNTKEAIRLLELARQSVPDFSFTDELGDVYRQAGQPGRAQECAAQVVKSLTNVSGDPDAPSHGHYADRELALAYVKTGDLDKALEHAKIEFGRRPNNIDVLETIAWIHDRRREYPQADKLMARALRTHSRNPVLLARAGLVALHNGNRPRATTLIRTALERNPYLEPTLAAEARPVLSAVAAR